MKRRTAGFSILELLMAVAITSVVLAAAITFFIVSVRQYKTQTKITETNLEGILGLELLRKDLVGLGFGLPWNNIPAYTERTGVNAGILALNDGAGIAPRPIISIDGATFTVNQSDYLVVKSASVGMSDAAGKWTLLNQAGVAKSWIPASEDLVAADTVIVLTVGSTDNTRRSSVTTGTGTLFNNTAAFVPTGPAATNIIYGIDNGPIVRPFNRADYYITNVDVTVPRRCAPNTGVLVKAVIAHDGSGSPVLYPLLDCVADMKVVYGIDNNADGRVDVYWPDLAGLTAAQIRAQLAEVDVSILAQEGQLDNTYTHPVDPIFVGSQGIGRNVSITGVRNCRWRLYSIVVRPMNLWQ